MTINVEVVTKGRIFKKKYWWVEIRCDSCDRYIIACNSTKDPFMRMREVDIIMCKQCSTDITGKVEALTFKEIQKQLEYRKRGFE